MEIEPQRITVGKETEAEESGGKRRRQNGNNLLMSDES